MLATFLLGATFLFIQINEYVHIGFAPQDFAQGSIFYGLTGLHGAHVFIGLTLLAMVVVRSFRGHFTPEEHRGVEVPGIYWHFVDVMWIVVYFVDLHPLEAADAPAGPAALRGRDVPRPPGRPRRRGGRRRDRPARPRADLGAGPRADRQDAGAPAGYLTVSLPSMPAALWPATAQ